MNDRELDKIMKSVPMPERSTEFWALLPKRVTAQLQRQPRQASATHSNAQKFDFVDWALGLGVVGAVCVVSLLCQPGGGFPAETKTMAAAEKCYRETEALFPNQVQAIVFDDAGPHIILSEKADVPKSPPLYLKICGPRGCQEIITFSGQQVRVNSEVCDVLTDSTGNIILSGDHLTWSSQSPIKSRGGYQIEARAMEASS